MSNIPFKAIAVDMDGTFMNSENKYDHAAFRKILTQIKQKHLHFIVSSGRPLDRLRIDFADFLNEIDIIAENGAVLVRDNRIINTHYFTYKTVIKLIRYIHANYPHVSLIVSGMEHSYMLSTAPADFKAKMSFFYPNKTEISNYDEIPTNTRITKITLWSDKSPKDLEKEFNHELSERIHVTPSGFKYTDVIPYGVNKASALKYFLRYFDLKTSELIAFGDGMNDSEMLSLAGYSYAMANADPELKKIAKYEAPSNDDNGVFKILKKYLNN